MIDSFWTTSGRLDVFKFERVAVNNYEKSLGYLDGVIGGSLTFGYNTDLKVSGSLDISATKFIENCILRIHYCPSLDESQKKDIVLCTCYAYTDEMKFDKGRYTGTLELASTLARYTDDVLQTDFTIGKNKTYKNELRRMLKRESSGGKYKFVSDVSDKKCSSAEVFEKGKSQMEVIQKIADGLGAQVGVDAKGTMTFKKYIAPSKKSCTYKLPSGQYSVTLPGVEINTGKSDMPGRIAYHCEVSWKQKVYVLDKNGKKQKYTSGTNKGKYKTKTETKKTTIVGRAQVKKTSPLHCENRGRWITQVFSYNKKIGGDKVSSAEKVDETLIKIQKEANTKAASKLSSLTSGTRTYSIECYYLPIECGQVVEFEYVASGIKLHVQAMITSIELELSAGAKMKVTLKHVRYV